MNSRILSDIDRSLTVMESLFNGEHFYRVLISIPIKIVNSIGSIISNHISKPIREGVKNRKEGFRFQEKEEREYQNILDFLDDHPGFLQESHEHTKLVTPNHRADNPLDPLRYPLPYTEKESRMDQGAPPRDRRKPSQ